ncbi:Methionyl-tRNA formyltransferase [Coemansia sp. RSA 552]|nr:Methionyl-tRNA formyltransferase [Coemansia sp. RSA 552]
MKKRGLGMKVDWTARTLLRARKLNLKVHHTPPGMLTNWEVPLVDEGCGGGKFDIGVVASFGKFLPRRVIEGFPLGMINVHPSLLPKYRGPSPIQTAILNGDGVTGVTVQEVHPIKMDAGRVLAQVPYELNDTLTRVDLMYQLGHLGGGLAAKVLANLEAVRARAQEQNEEEATYTRLYEKNDMKIVWESMSADDISRMQRAHMDHMPVHSFLRVKNKYMQVNLNDARLPIPGTKPLREDFLDCVPGTLVHVRKTPVVEFPCLHGGRIHASNFTVSGKAPRDAYQFNAGYIKKCKGMRLVTDPGNTKYPFHHDFVYPEGYVPPTKPYVWPRLVKESPSNESKQSKSSNKAAAESAEEFAEESVEEFAEESVEESDGDSPEKA